MEEKSQLLASCHNVLDAGIAIYSTPRITPSRLESLRTTFIQLSQSVQLAKTQRGYKGSTQKLQWRRTTRWLKRMLEWFLFHRDQQYPQELKSLSDKTPTLLSRATGSHLRFWQKSTIMSLEIPYENFVGSILGGQYQLQFLEYQEDHLDVYSVTSFSGLSFEAQAFSLGGLSAKLLQARKRRMKRLVQSKNFVCEIEQAGKRFLIINIERSSAEWKKLNQKVDQYIPVWMNHAGWMEHFPELSGIGCQRESFPSDFMTKDTNLVISSRLPNGLNSLSSCSSCSSYAEVASKGLECNQVSKTPKGIKQRKRRQRKREERILNSPRRNKHDLAH